MRKEAFERIREIGFPTRKSEDWLAYPVARLAGPKVLDSIRQGVLPASDRDADDSETRALSANDFRIDSETSFSALLPMALGARPLVREIAAGETENGILKARDEFSHTIFYIGDGATVSLEILENKLEREISAERLDFFVGENATLELFSTESGHASELKFRTIRIRQGKNSQVHILDLNRTDSLRRTDVETRLEGEGSRFGFRALNIVSGETGEHDFVRVFHNAPKCESRQFVRNLISGRANVSYDGGVTAGKDCPGTDSSELVNTLLLSDDAKIFVKPTLKIYHDDVACSHGNTVGSLDEESIFYLESRGIERNRAENLLIRAFARDVIAEHPFEAGRRRLSPLLDASFR